MRTGPIVQLVLNDVLHDARVVKAGRALAGVGARVLFVGAHRVWRPGRPFLDPVEAIPTRSSTRGSESPAVAGPPVPAIERLLINDPYERPYDATLAFLNQMNPFWTRDGGVGQSFERALGSTPQSPGGGSSDGVSALNRARTLALAGPYGAAFALQRAGLFGRMSPVLQSKLRRRRLVDALVQLSPRVVHAHDLSAFALVAEGLSAAGVPMVYECHELETGRNAPSWTAQQRAEHAAMERNAIHLAQRVVTVAPAIARRLASLYAIPMPTVVTNAPPAANIRENTRLATRLGLPAEHRVILYLGVRAQGRGLELLLSALPRLPRTIHVAFLGRLAPAYRRRWSTLLDELGPDRARVHVLEPVPYDEVLHTASGADLGFNALELLCESYRHALPNKFFEYVFAGVPVISTPQTDVARLTEEYGLGVVVGERDLDAFINAVGRLLLGTERGLDPDRRAAFVTAHSAERQAARLVEMYRDAGWLAPRAN